nr:hypothetical protein CFP56_34773 [Quercus suber]
MATLLTTLSCVVTPSVTANLELPAVIVLAAKISPDIDEISTMRSLSCHHTYNAASPCTTISQTAGLTAVAQLSVMSEDL